MFKEDYMTAAEAAVYLEYKQEYVCNLCKNGKFPGATKFGNKMWAIPKQSVYGYEKNGQGFAAVKVRKEKEKAIWLTKINAAIQAAKNLATA